MEVAEKEDRERERKTEIASLKAFTKSLQNKLAAAKTFVQTPKSEVPATSSKSEVPPTSPKSEVSAISSKSEVPATSKFVAPAPSESQPSTSEVQIRK